MGGGGTPATPYATSITGMTGGRVIPGSNSTANAVGSLTSKIGSGGGSVGGSYTTPEFSGGGSILAYGGGGGGGWGAAGGSMINDGNLTSTSPVTINPGAAGGKAINTNSYAVTFTGGSNRVYGVIG